MEDKKVFCYDCKYYDKPYTTITDDCLAEGNRRYKPDYQRNWWVSIRRPKEINKSNDCRWFK